MRTATVLGQPVTTTEATSKSLKARTAIAVLAMVFGFVLAVTNAGEAVGMLGVVMMLGGFSMYVYIAVRRWWHHG